MTAQQRYISSCHYMFGCLTLDVLVPCLCQLWDQRQASSVHTFDRRYAVTSVALAGDASLVFVGGLDNQIAVYDTRKQGEQVYSLAAHTDTITATRLSPDGSYLLSNSMDNTLRIWDVRPYAPVDRCVKVFHGAQHNFEKNLLRCAWSPDGGRIACGSADRFVYVFDTTSRQILYKLPGHTGSVNDVDFHPTEPIIGSCGSDKKVYLGEISSS